MILRQTRRNKSSGFIKAIVVILIALIVLGYFGFNVTEILKKPTVSSNLEFAYNGSKYIWSNYLSGPTQKVWSYMLANVGANQSSTTVNE